MDGLSVSFIATRSNYIWDAEGVTGVRINVSWRINTYPIATRVLDDRLLIPADRTLRFDATLYSHTYERSFHAIKHTESRESLKFWGGCSGPEGGHGYRSNWRGWNEQWSKTYASASTNINANRLLRTSECLVKQTWHTGQCMLNATDWNDHGLIEKHSWQSESSNVRVTKQNFKHSVVSFTCNLQIYMFRIAPLSDISI